MTEQQSHDVLAAYPEFELRRYPEHLVAEIEVGGPFELAGNLAFSGASGMASAVLAVPRNGQVEVTRSRQ